MIAEPSAPAALSPLMRCAAWLCCNNQAWAAAGRVVTLPKASSRLDFKPFTNEVNRLRERTDTDAEAAFDNACLATDVLGELKMPA